MSVRILLACLILASVAGCLDDTPTPQQPVEAPTLPPAAVTVYSGSVAFGKPTVAGTGQVVPEVFGTTGSTDVSSYGPEPNIGVTSDGSVFTTAFSTVMRSQDHGRNWSAVHTHEPADLNNDPMLWVDPWTDRVYNAPMFPTLLCSALYWSDDMGDAWTPNPTPACGTGAFDHQKLASGPPGPDAPAIAGLLHPTVTYLCYNGVAITNCMVSYDGGQTWPVDEPTAVNLVGVTGAGGEVSQISPCFSGQNGHPTVSPDGVVVMMRTWSCTQPILTLSTDSGLTWTNIAGPPFPGGASDFLTTANAHSIDPEVAFTSDGAMYVLFQSHDHHAYVARSDDLGASWAGPWDVTPPGTNSTVFAALGAGDPGRIAIGLLAANVTGSSTNAPDDARWDLHIITSQDAHAEDPTWVDYQVTDDDPVQVGPILQGGGTDNTRNLLDFIDGAVGPDGRFYVGYTDGCNTFNGCAELPREEQTSAFRGSAGAVAWLEGWSLLEAPRDGPLPL